MLLKNRHAMSLLLNAYNIYYYVDTSTKIIKFFIDHDVVGKSVNLGKNLAVALTAAGNFVENNKNIVDKNISTMFNISESINGLVGIAIKDGAFVINHTLKTYNRQKEIPSYSEHREVEDDFVEITWNPEDFYIENISLDDSCETDSVSVYK